MKFWFTPPLWFLLLVANSWQFAAAALSSADLPLEARDESGSQEEDIISTSYVLPNQIFNDGKPYYASKDPISGQLDFNAKKPAGIETAVNEVIDPKEKIVLSDSSPNIHDYLNLPVKYSSSKFVYPLVSSSYANLKYQGSNKNYTTNKKPISVEASAATPPPNYRQHPQQQPQQHLTIPTTKLMAVSKPAQPQPTTSTTSTGSSSSSKTTTTSTTTTTSKKPVSPTIASTTTTKAVPPTSTSIQTSIATSTSMFTPPKYNSVTRRPIPILSTTQPPKQTTTTTRKKFVPTKKYMPTGTSPTTAAAATPAPTPTNPFRLPEPNTNGAPKLKPTIPATSTTPNQPTKPSSIFPTDATSTKFSSTPPHTKPPVSITEQQLPLLPTQNKPSGSTTRIPNLDPADVYQSLGQKHGAQSTEHRPTMTLADIFNSLAEEESAVASNNQGNQGFDAQGNLMQPIAPSKPTPFAMQDSNKNVNPASNNQQQQQQQQQPQQKPPQQFNNDQNVFAGSQENYSNEYVSYQVQQPNVMQYRPAPGAINNVVISPGQHSATFVLGSQQQVGHNAFGSAEKEPMFGNERPVQYGTVINESPPQKPTNFPTTSQTPTFQNVPHNGNFGNSEEPPPAPPSPYQQLPLVGGPNLRPHTGNAQQNIPPNTNTELPANYAPTSQQQNPQSSDTQELLVSTNIRFPLNEEQSEEQLSGPVAAGPPAGPHVNGHAQPLSLQQIKQSNTVAFPKTKDDDLTQGEQYQGNVGAEDIQIQQHEVLTMNQHKQTLSFPQTSEQHTPSTHMEPPPPPPPQQPNVEHSDLHKRPHPNRPHGPPPPPPFAYNEYTRNPIPGITRPNPDRKLPNILPQFRPNAKISSGHAAPNFNLEPGNIRIPPGPPGPPLKRPHPNMGSPQFAHRRQPLMQQQRYPTNRLVDFPNGMPHPADANRRVYRLPSYGGQGFPYADRMYPRRPMPYAAMRPIVDSYAVERHAPALNPDVYKTIVPQDPNLPPERMAAFEEEDLVINDPPQPVTPSKDPKYIDESKLEPVVTLQMLQSQKKPLSLPNDDTGSGEIQVPPESENFDPNLEKPTSQNGLYVVYPMNGKKNAAQSETLPPEALPAIAHVESATGSDYQNTPFSVIRDQPEEPVLQTKKKPQSLQQHSKTQSLKDKFPYPIEKPDPSFNELHVKKGVPGVLIAPRIVHGIYPTGTETPIAIAYTPTEPSPYRKHGYTKYSSVNLASSVIGEIRHDTQTEDGLNNDFDLRGQNFEKNFMAPFYPSVSLGTATSAPAGWNILPSTTDSKIYEKNKIDRADVVDSNAVNVEEANKNFENDHFQPELQGGFKPIYPPGYKIDDEDDNGNEAERLQQHESNNRPLALASRMESTTTTSSTTTTTAIAPRTTTVTTSTTSMPTETSTLKTNNPKEVAEENTTIKHVEPTKSQESSTKAPSTTPKPTQRKKTPFETSLEALLFGDDEEFEGEGRKQKAKAKSAPLSVPRMGPRSLKLS